MTMCAGPGWGYQQTRLVARIAAKLATMAEEAEQVREAIDGVLSGEAPGRPDLAADLQRIDVLQQTLVDLSCVLSAHAERSPYEAADLESLASVARLREIACLVRDRPEPTRAAARGRRKARPALTRDTAQRTRMEHFTDCRAGPEEQRTSRHMRDKKTKSAKSDRNETTANRDREQKDRDAERRNDGSFRFSDWASI